MKALPNALPAYADRRKALRDQLAQVKAKASTDQIQLALLVTDLCVATLHDLHETSEFNITELSRQSESFDVAAGSAPSQMEPGVDENNSEMSRFVAMMANVQGRAACNIFSTQLLRAELLHVMGLMWIELLRDLFTADDRRLFFDRLEKLFDFASTKLPVVGDILEILKTAAEAYALRKIQAKEADKYLLSLESYIDAGNVYLVGALGFCEHVNRLLNHLPPPTDDEVQARVDSHIKAVTEGTHATTVRTDA